MFLAETGVLVLLSILFSFLLIINMGELIEDLLGTSLASLFAWDIIWIPLLTVAVLFLLAGGIPGKLFSRIPVTQVFRHYTDGKRGWKRSLLFVQFTGTSFVLGLLLVTLLQYSHLMNGDMGIKIPGLVEACLLYTSITGMLGLFRCVCLAGGRHQTGKQEKHVQYSCA